jgi:hypothetical protein
MTHLLKLASAFDARDVIGAIGVGSLAYGLYQVYPPAAFIVTGAIGVYVGLFGTR